MGIARARHAEAERFTEAAQAYEKALALPSKVPRDPAVWCEYADALGMTQQGKLAGKPRQLIDHALALKPDHPKALEMAGSAEYELGDYAAASGGRCWRNWNPHRRCTRSCRPRLPAPSALLRGLYRCGDNNHRRRLSPIGAACVETL